jgi:hypothetical protein
MVILITLVQETWLGGVSFGESSFGVLTLAGAFTFLAAVVGGYLTALLAPGNGIAHAGVICLLVVAETTYLITSGRVEGPLWFDLAGGASLLVGLLLGAWLRRFFPSTPRTSSPSGVDSVP